MSQKARRTFDDGQLGGLFVEFHKFGFDEDWQLQLVDLHPVDAHTVIAERRAILRMWFLRSQEDDDHTESAQYVDLYRMVDDLLAAIQTALIASTNVQTYNISTDSKQ